jgi:hypothetical protein
MKKTVLVVLTLAVAMCATAAWGQGGPPPGGPRGMGSVAMAIMPPRADMTDCITSSLELTTAQATALKSILTTSDSTIQPLMKTAADKCKALRAGIFDSDNVATLLKDAQTAEQQVIDACMNTWTAIAVSADLNLTSDQLTKLVTGPPCGGPPHGPPPSGSGSGGSSSSQTAGRR